MNLKKIGISLRVEKIEKFNEKRDDNIKHAGMQGINYVFHVT